MKQVKLTSIYGKTITLEDAYDGGGRVSVTVRDEGDVFVRNILLSKTEVDRLRNALALPVVPATKWAIVRQNKKNPHKIKVCCNGTAGQKQYTHEGQANDAARRLNEQYGEDYNYTVVAL